MNIIVKSALIFILIHKLDAMRNFANVECGKVSHGRSGKIVGGQDASHGEFPWLVSITRRGGHFCGGSLVTNRHVLTAGHCMCSGVGSNILQPPNIKITLGQHDLSSSTFSAYEMSVMSITVHPEYVCNKPRNDVAVISLEKEIEWTKFVAPACLPSPSDDPGYNTFENSLATVAGWGWTNEHTQQGGRAKILQKAEVSVIENETCEQWYKSQGKKTKIQGSQICAGHQQGGVDSCWADSGGPLMVKNGVVSNQMIVVGVVSTGVGCARPFLPGLYTRVSEYIPWINSVIN